MIKLCFFKFLVFVCLIFVGLAGFAFSQTENSCTTCVAASKKWCAGVGCIAATSNCPPNAVAVISTDTNGCANVDTCDGCTSATKGNKSWCTVNDHKGKPAQIYCTPKVANGQPNPACSGTTHNVCPTDAKLLDALPVYKDCAACKAGAPNVSALKKWCVSKYFQGCIDAGDDCSDGTKHDDCTDATIAGKLDYLITSTCGTCVHTAGNQWCKLEAHELEAAYCSTATPAPTNDSGGSSSAVGAANTVATTPAPGTSKCFGAQLGTCTSNDESFVIPHPFSYNCEICTQSGHKWCIQTAPVGQVVARFCKLVGDCPAGFTAKINNCLSLTPQKHGFTYLPSVDKAVYMTKSCKTCKPANSPNSWCKSPAIGMQPGVKVCLPSDLFGFYCPTADATCPIADESYLLPTPPVHIGADCTKCKAVGGHWCKTTFESKVYRACFLKLGLCEAFGGSVVSDCSNMNDMKPAIPELPETCEKCILQKSTHKWCVSLVFGLKVNACLLDLLVPSLCPPGHGVAYNHCNIADEDKTQDLGFYNSTYSGAGTGSDTGSDTGARVPKLGSSVVSSVSLMATAVGFILSMF